MTKILTLIQGGTEINLLDPNNINLLSWQPSIVQVKGGGITNDNILSDGNELVYRQWDNGVETFVLYVVGSSQDTVGQKVKNLVELLEKGVTYWLNNSIATPTYLTVKGDSESTPRYAIVKKWKIDNLPDFFEGPYQIGAISEGEAFDSAVRELVLVIERGHWLANPPGQSEGIDVANTYTWTARGSLSEISSDPAGGLERIVVADNGDLVARTGIMAGDDTERIEVSDDDGVNWTTVKTFGGYWSNAGNHWIHKADNGYLYTEGCESGSGTPTSSSIYRSVDNGANWTAVYTFAHLGDTNAVTRSITSTPNGYVYAVTRYQTSGLYFQLVRSIDNGATWTTVYSENTHPLGIILGLSNNWLLMSYQQQVTGSRGYRLSKDYGVTWQTISTDNLPHWSWGWWPTQLASGRIIAPVTGALVVAGASYGAMFHLSDDFGETWYPVDYGLDGVVLYEAQQDSLGDLFATGNATYKSDNEGLTWAVYEESDLYTQFILSNDTDVYAYGFFYDKLYQGTVTTTETFGLNGEETFVSNYMSQNNLTIVKTDDGGSFADVFPGGDLPYQLFPDVPVTGDAIYFGIGADIVQAAPFFALAFDLVPGETTGTGVAWSYWNGSTWYTLNESDYTSDFYTAGTNIVAWGRPANWATNSVDGVSAYWVRAVVNSASVTWTVIPQQQNQPVFVVNQPYIELSDISGDIGATIAIRVTNDSQVTANRVIVGSRALNRGPGFTAYINMSEYQTLPGLTVAAGTATTFVTDPTIPTSDKLHFNPTGAASIATRATITFGPDIATSFYGTFRVFVRAQQSGGSAGDVGVRVVFTSGSGGISYTTDTRYLATSTAYELLDFGQISLPIGGAISYLNISDQMTINIQASSVDGTPNLYLLDLIMIPVDEWSIDAMDGANSSTSVLGTVSGKQRYMLIDSVSIPKVQIKATVHEDSSGHIVSIYKPITVGQARLAANLTQRLWFLFARTSTTGTSYSWLADPNIFCGVSVSKNDRYLTLRGSS